jgi:hypothetical protein
LKNIEAAMMESPALRMLKVELVASALRESMFGCRWPEGSTSSAGAVPRVDMFFPPSIEAKPPPQRKYGTSGEN